MSQKTTIEPALAPNGNLIKEPFQYLTTGEPLPPVYDYKGPEDAPDEEGLILPVVSMGAKVGEIKCINVASGLRWFGRNAAGNITGNAKSRNEAASDVICWHEGRSPEYVQHGLKPRVAHG